MGGQMRPDVDLDRLRAAVLGLRAANPSLISEADLHRFIESGMAALTRTDDPPWVQFGLALTPRQLPELADAIADLAHAMLAQGSIENFFFMCKPPGLRVRFQLRPGQPSEPIEAAVRTWRARGLITSASPGHYEPEQTLLGGPASMRHVHRLFTADALAWLAFHRQPAHGAEWVFSLALLRDLHEGLAIVGWEDLEVWERIRTQASRELPYGLTEEKLARASEGIRDAWARPELIPAALPAEIAVLLAEWGPRLTEIAREWYTEYFCGGSALIGPREAAAFVTIFHWNRGRLSAGLQSMIATALADRKARP
jgi:thiopeptide-type bacteriocin biosynthesis protein